MSERIYWWFEVSKVFVEVVQKFQARIVSVSRAPDAKSFCLIIFFIWPIVLTKDVNAKRNSMQTMYFPPVKKQICNTFGLIKSPSKKFEYRIKIFA